MQNENLEVNDTVIFLKKIVLEQLKSSKDLNIEYKLCVDYLNNYKEDKYKELMVSRTGMSSIELFKYAQEVVSNVSSWIYHALTVLTEHQQSDVMNDPKKMDAFLVKVNNHIKEVIGDAPVFSTKRG